MVLRPATAGRHYHRLITALARTGDFALIQDARVRSGILGYVSQLQADLEEFRREVDFHKEAVVRLGIRGEVALTPDVSPGFHREVRLNSGTLGAHVVMATCD